MTSSLRHPEFVGNKGCDELMAPYGQGFDNLLPVGLTYGEGSHGLCHIEDLVNTHANICSFEQPFFFPLWEAASPLIIRPYISGMGVESRMWRHFILFAVRRWQLSKNRNSRFYRFLHILGFSFGFCEDKLRSGQSPTNSPSKAKYVI